jgi:hypothetical protein
MLTAKTVSPVGFERVEEINMAEYSPTITDKEAAEVKLYHDDWVESVRSGDVFVMNENGSTVAVYHLVQFVG